MYDWFDFLRVCLSCGVYEPPIDILCSKCWEHYKVMSKMQLTTNSLNYNFTVKRAWVWGRKNNEYIKKIIYNLKCGHSEKVFEKLALLILQKVIFDYYFDRKLIFVPAPGARPKKNHALYIARALSSITGCDFKDILFENKNNKKQKRLSRLERENKKFEVKGSFKLQGNEQIIFIDDVITTGATAKAAFKALGSPQNFEVWVLAEKLYSYNLQNRAQKRFVSKAIIS